MEMCVKPRVAFSVLLSSLVSADWSPDDDLGSDWGMTSSRKVEKKTKGIHI